MMNTNTRLILGWRNSSRNEALLADRRMGTILASHPVNCQNWIHLIRGKIVPEFVGNHEASPSGPHPHDHELDSHLH